MCDEEAPVIVIDNGSGVCRAGIAGEDGPSVSLSSVVGYPKHTGVMLGMERQDKYVGNDAQEKRDVLHLHYPTDRGVVTDWDDMEQIWHQVFFRELQADPKESLVLLSEPMLSSKRHREKLCEVMFETFQASATCVELQPVLTAYGGGACSATYVESGEGLTQIMPLYEGRAIPEAAMKMDLAGQDLTDHMAQLLTSRGYRFHSSAEREALRAVKETHCYVAEDFTQEMLHSTEFPPPAEPVSASFGGRDFQLPDGQKLTIREERFQCPEAFFRPSLLGKDCPGIHEAIFQSVMKSPIDTRRDMFAFIYLSGGNTLFPGIANRIKNEIINLAPDARRRIRVVDTAERKYSVWIGGSILGSLSMVWNLSLTKEMYEEKGVSGFPTRSPLSY